MIKSSASLHSLTWEIFAFIPGRHEAGGFDVSCSATLLASRDNRDDGTARM